MIPANHQQPTPNTKHENRQFPFVLFLGSPLISAGVLFGLSIEARGMGAGFLDPGVIGFA